MSSFTEAEEAVGGFDINECARKDADECVHPPASQHRLARVQGCSRPPGRLSPGHRADRQPCRRSRNRDERVRGAAWTGISPYHYENPEEEWLIALRGRPTVRHPQGEDELQPWDVVFFPPGPDGAHAVRNDSDSTASVLMSSSTSTVAASVYPGSNKIAIWTGNADDDIIVKRTSGVGYWDGESPRGSSVR